VTGDLHIAGAMTLSRSGIDFLPADTGTGSFFVVAGTGTFAPLVGMMGTIKDVAPPPASAITPSLLTLPGGVHFDSTTLYPGVFTAAACGAAPAAGQTCSPAGVPVNLTNVTLNMSTLSFAGAGSFVSGTDVTPYTAVLTAQFANMSYQTLIATLQAGGTVTTSYSASLAPIPEPGTLAMMLAGVGAVGFIARRLKSR
jgi:hypothetical protein